MAREEMCLNHPNVPAETRCRQCQKPICKECIKSDADGQFCSFDCSSKFKDFQRSQKPEAAKKGGMAKKIIIALIVLAVAVFVSGKFFGCGICQKILEMVGLG